MLETLGCECELIVWNSLTVVYNSPRKFLECIVNHGVFFSLTNSCFPVTAAKNFLWKEKLNEERVDFNLTPGARIRIHDLKGNNLASARVTDLRRHHASRPKCFSLLQATGLKGRGLLQSQV